MGGKVLSYRSKELYQEALAKGREEGLAEGIDKGVVKGLANLVVGKYQRGESVEKIAGDLLMNTSEVEELLNHQKEA